MTTFLSSPRPLPAFVSPRSRETSRSLASHRCNGRNDEHTPRTATRARNVAARSSSPTSSRALDAPPPSSTRPGEAWAELVPSTRQFEALEHAFVTVVGRSEAGPVAVSSLLLGERAGRRLDAGEGTKTLLVVARSFGCPFCQELAASLSQSSLLLGLESAGVSLYLVSIGTPETGREFSALTGFPEEKLLADPGTQVYDALGLERGAASAFLSPRTPLAVARRASTDEGRRSLRRALGKWKPFLPPRVIEDAKYQGGALLFEGETCVWARLDRATADHLPAEELVEVALRVR